MVRGIEFTDEAVVPVERLVTLIEEMAGKDSFYDTYVKRRWLFFALNTPKGKRKRAQGIFVMIGPTPTGARVWRPRIPKTGPKEYRLTAENVETVFKTVEHWYEEVRGLRAPVGYQSTGNSNVLPGGQFESNKSKF